MSRSFQCLAVLGVVCCAAVIGCGPKGPGTAPVKGTLTIDGQPADNVMITLAPMDASLPMATGMVKGGSFEVFSGIEGAAGAVPGKYKVVLAPGTASSAEEAAKRYSGGGQAGKSGSPEPDAGAALPFAAKYTSAATSDKDVEITQGENNLTIDVSSQ